MIPRIVITGAPGSGKTEFLKRLQGDSAFADFLFFDELARSLLNEDPTYRHRWNAFHLEIYRRQCAREHAAGNRPFITDRGTVDAFAFHPETARQVGTSVEREYTRYSAVVHLESAAQLGERFYCCDAVRNETIDEAVAIERAIRRIWQRHPGYQWVAANTDIEMKYRQFAALMRRLAAPVSST